MVDKNNIYRYMALKDWVRHEGEINSTPRPLPHSYQNDEHFIMLVRSIQYDDIAKNRYKNFNSLYDVAMMNTGNYIPVNNNYELHQEPPDPTIINQYKRKMNIK